MIVTITVMVGLTVGLVAWNLHRGFLAYINQLDAERVNELVPRFERYYSEQGNWHGISDHPRVWRTLIEGGSTFLHPPERPKHRRRKPHQIGNNQGLGTLPDAHHRPPPKHQRPPPHRKQGNGIGIGPRLVLFDHERRLIIGRVINLDNLSMHPIKHQETLVGWLGLAPLQKLNRSIDQEFINSQTTTFYFIVFAAILISILGSILISRHLLHPIRKLAEATHQLAEGDFNIRLKIKRNDELGDLASDFNHLANALEKSQELRQQWVLDIAHELRTPLSVLRGEVEAIQDGVRQWNSKQAQSIHSEIMRLTRLVEGLYTLSQADQGNLLFSPQRIYLDKPVRVVVEKLTHRFAEKSIIIEWHQPESMHVLLNLDEDQIEQLFMNLFENSLRYTSPGGLLMIQTHRHEGVFSVVVKDSAPGVPTDALPKLFDRLFRVEASRNREFGGAGIGLSICQRIVEAHGGTIEAAHADIGGLAITIRFPLEN